MTEYWSTLVRGLSRANWAAVEALEAPAETGEDVHVGMGSWDDLKAGSGGGVLRYSAPSIIIRSVSEQVSRTAFAA